MKKTKDIFKVIIIITLIILSFKVILNKLIIKNYNNNQFNYTLSSILYLLNIQEPYIAYYNNGNIYLKNEEYDKAINNYKIALKKKPTRKRVCDIRINLSIATINRISPSTKEEIYRQLEEAKQYLYKNDCAHPFDNLGYSKTAEELEEEINILQSELEDYNSSTNNKDDKDDKDNEQKNEQDKNKSEEEKIKEEIKKSEKEAKTNREEDLNYYDQMNSNQDYYSGKKW